MHSLRFMAMNVLNGQNFLMKKESQENHAGDYMEL